MSTGCSYKATKIEKKHGWAVSAEINKQVGAQLESGMTVVRRCLPVAWGLMLTRPNTGGLTLTQEWSLTRGNCLRETHNCD